MLARDGDAALVRRARRGSEDAMEALIRRHWDAAHRAAFLVVRDAAAAEDIAQESLLAAVDAIDSFDRRRSFAPWLHKIVVNRALDWLRAARRRPEVAAAHAPEPAAEAADAALVDGLSEALGRLDADSRAALVLRYVLDYRSHEIAAMLDMPAATVRTRLARALERLRALLEEERA